VFVVPSTSTAVMDLSDVLAFAPALDLVLKDPLQAWDLFVLQVLFINIGEKPSPVMNISHERLHTIRL
jgi:hypothetical protein